MRASRTGDAAQGQRGSKILKTLASPSFNFTPSSTKRGTAWSAGVISPPSRQGALDGRKISRAAAALARNVRSAGVLCGKSTSELG